MISQLWLINSTDNMMINTEKFWSSVRKPFSVFYSEKFHDFYEDNTLVGKLAIILEKFDVNMSKKNYKENVIVGYWTLLPNICKSILWKKNANLTLFRVLSLQMPELQEMSAVVTPIKRNRNVSGSSLREFKKKIEWDDDTPDKIISQYCSCMKECCELKGVKASTLSFLANKFYLARRVKSTFLKHSRWCKK